MHFVRDCTSENIMMDASPIFPNGHHPVRRSATPNGVHVAHPLSRIDHPVKYYFIDFGISTRFGLGEPTLVVGAIGRDKELPELSEVVQYNAMQADVFILGNMYRKDLLQVSADIVALVQQSDTLSTQRYHGLDFLDPLISSMTERVPSQRPTAPNALSQFNIIKSNLNTLVLRWRLRPREESVPERVVYDTVAVARETYHHLKKIVGQ